LDPKLRDQITSHRILNYLNASYQGRFAGLNVLLQLKHPALDPKQLENTKEVLQKCATWLDRLFSGDTLFQHERATRQMPEAQSAMTALAALQPELAALASEAKTAQQTPDLEKDPRQVGLLISAYGRSIYGQALEAQTRRRLGVH
jgi:hypothetical protein